MKDILISVIVPIYNVEAYLAACVHSVTASEHSDETEVLLIDDGSTDSSGALADALAAQYPQVSVFHKENGGLSDARNYGLQRATGRYVLFLDSDDLLPPGGLDRICAAAAREQADVLLWDAAIVDEAGAPLPDQGYAYRHDGLLPGQRGSGQALVYAQLKQRGDYPTTVWLGLYRRAFLLEHDLWFEKGLLHEDELWSQQVLVEAAEAVYLGDTLYLYRRRMNSIMRQQSRDHTRNLEALISIFNRLPEYYDARVADPALRRLMKANNTRRCLHHLAAFEISRYPALVGQVQRWALLQNAGTLKDRLRAALLLLSPKLYCSCARRFSGT